MSERPWAHVPSPRHGELGADELLARLPDATLLTLTALRVDDLSPLVRRIHLSGPDLRSFRYKPNQDLMVEVASDGSRVIRRRYTVRSHDAEAGTLALDVVLHGGTGPGDHWAKHVAPGDAVRAIGPRGKVTLKEAADWHLLVGDETAMPGIAAMVESLQPGQTAVAVVEVGTPDEEQEIAVPSHADVTWRWLRRSAGPDDAEGVLAALAATSLPPGSGHAYLAGEATLVASLTDGLRSFAPFREPSTVSAKAYWRVGHPNASHGEPLKSSSRET